MNNHLRSTDSLQDQLYDLLYRAQRAPGTFQSLRLASGLLIEVVYHDRHIHLQISHEDIFPTAEEYWEVLDNWPLKIGRQPPRASVHSGRKYMASTWPASSLPDG